MLTFKCSLLLTFVLFTLSGGFARVCHEYNIPLCIRTGQPCQVVSLSDLSRCCGLLAYNQASIHTRFSHFKLPYSGSLEPHFELKTNSKQHFIPSDNGGYENTEETHKPTSREPPMSLPNAQPMSCARVMLSTIRVSTYACHKSSFVLTTISALSRSVRSLFLAIRSLLCTSERKSSLISRLY